MLKIFANHYDSFAMQQTACNAGDPSSIPGSGNPLEKEMAEDEMAGWHHRLEGSEFE